MLGFVQRIFGGSSSSETDKGSDVVVDPKEAFISDARPNALSRHIQVRCEDVGDNDDGSVFYLVSEDGKEHYIGACMVSGSMLGADQSVFDKFVSALSLPFPAGSFVQIGRMMAPDVEDWIDAYLSRKHGAEGVLSAMAHKRAELFRDAASGKKALIETQGTLLMSQRTVITLKVPCKPRPNDEQIHMAREHIARFESAMMAAGLPLRRLDAAGYLGLLDRLHHMYLRYDQRHYDDRLTMREQMYAPGQTVKFDRDQIAFDDGAHYCRLLSVKQLPRRTSLAVMNYLVGDPHGLTNQLTEPYYLNLTLHYPDQPNKVADVKRRAAMINQQVFGPSAHLIPSLGYKKAGFDTLIHELEGNGGMLVEMCLTLAMFSRDEMKLARQTAAMTSYYASLQMEMREDKRILKPLWYGSVLPLNSSRSANRNLFRYRTLMVAHAACFLPVFGEYTGTRSASMMLMSRRGSPLIWCPFDSDTNYNGSVYAESGSGKSFFMQQFVADFLAQGAKVWVIDQGKSFFKLAKALREKAQCITFEENSDLCLNPFTHCENIQDDMALIKAMIAKMAAPTSGLDDYQFSRVEEAISSVWTTYGNNADIHAIAEWCLSQDDARVRDIGRQLYPYSRDGIYGRWFNGTSNVNMDADLVVMEMQDLAAHPDLQRVVQLQLMTRVTSEMFLTRGRQKVFLIDEARDPLRDPVMALAMEGFYRKVRKADGSAWVILQGLMDLADSASGRAIAANSAWSLILRQKAEQVDAAIEGKMLTLDGYGRGIAKSIHTVAGKYSEVMIMRSGSEWGVGRLVTDRFAGVLFSTRGDERNLIFDAVDRNEDVVEAINTYIAQRG